MADEIASNDKPTGIDNVTGKADSSVDAAIKALVRLLARGAARAAAADIASPKGGNVSSGRNDDDQS